jgi:hypothetical protein
MSRQRADKKPMPHHTSHHVDRPPVLDPPENVLLRDRLHVVQLGRELDHLRLVERRHAEDGLLGADGVVLESVLEQMEGAAQTKRAVATALEGRREVAGDAPVQSLDPRVVRDDRDVNLIGDVLDHLGPPNRVRMVEVDDLWRRFL